MSAHVLPEQHGREVLRCECGLIQFPTKDGKCRKGSCRLPYQKHEKTVEPTQVGCIPGPASFACLESCGQVTKAMPFVIKVLRLAHNLSQRDMASYMKCPRTYVSKIENGKARPNYKQLTRFSDIFGMNLWSLIRMCEVAAA